MELARVALVPSSAPSRRRGPAHTRVSATGAGSTRSERTPPPMVGRGTSAAPPTAATMTPTATRPLTMRAPTNSPLRAALRGALSSVVFGWSLIVAPVEGVGGVVAGALGSGRANAAEGECEQGGDSEQDAKGHPHGSRPRF